MRRHFRFLVVTAALALAGCAHRSAPPSPDLTPAAQENTQSSGTEVTKPPVDPNTLVAPMNQFMPHPPDGQWLVDEFGREYYIVDIPKVEGAYLMESPTRVRIRNGFRFDVTGSDEDSFFAKVYRPGDPTTPVTPPAPTQEDLDREARSYAPQTAETHRFDIVLTDSGLPRSGQWRNGFGMADLDGDGNIDLVHGAPRRSMNPRPVIFRGDGKGRFTPWKEAVFDAAPYDYGDVACGDFDGDGRLDLAFAVHLTGLIALRGDGHGRFVMMSDGLPRTEPASRHAGVPFTSRTVVAVDWDGDGRDEILALSEGPAGGGRGGQDYVGGKRLFRMETGSWRDISTMAGIDRSFGDDLAIGDFDGDGHPDFASASSQLGNRGVLHFGQADGTWQARSLESLRERGVVTAVASADIDGDGRDDIVTGQLAVAFGVWRSVVDLHFSRADGTWERRTIWSEEGTAAMTALTFGHVDDDRNLDLVALDQNGRTRLFPGSGDEHVFVRDAVAEVPGGAAGCRGYEVTLSDLDGDGRDEIVGSFAGESCPQGGGIHVWKVTSRR